MASTEQFSFNSLEGGQMHVYTTTQTYAKPSLETKYCITGYFSQVQIPEWAHNSGKFILGCCIKFDYGSLMELGASVYFIAVRGEISLHANPQPPRMLRYVINYSLSTNFHSSNLLVYPQYCHPRINAAWCNHNVFLILTCYIQCRTAKHFRYNCSC